MNTILKYKTLIVFLLSLSVGAQNFTDDFKKEDNGGIASQWKAVKGTGLVGEIDGVKVHKLDRYTVVTPIINGRSNNYLGEEFTVEFDAFFSEVPTATRQYYILHLWDGTGVHGENGKHADPYFIYRHGIRASGSFGNDKKINELAVLEQTWRHIKVHYAKNTLQIFIDDQLIHHQPNLFYKPTMVSLSARNNSGESGITNFSLNGGTEKNIANNLQLNFNKDIEGDAHEMLKKLLPKGIQSFSFSPNGGWVIITKTNEYFAKNIPEQCYEKIKEFVVKKIQIKEVIFPPNGGDNSWLIITEEGTFSKNIPDACYKKITELQNNGKLIQSVAFPYINVFSNSNDAWSIITMDGKFYLKNIPDECYQVMRNISQSDMPNKTAVRKINKVAFSPSGGWTVLAEDYFFSRNIPKNTFEKLAEHKSQAYNNTIVAFNPDKKGWSIVADIRSASSQVDLIRNFENNVNGISIWQTLRDNSVPGVAVAVVINGEVAWKVGYGHLIENDERYAVHPESMFQAASISKAFAAIGALKLVNDGKITLDEDLMISGKLQWTVPFNNCVKNEPWLENFNELTIKNILQHRSGIHGRGSEFDTLCQYKSTPLGGNSPPGGGYGGYIDKDNIPTLKDLMEDITITYHPNKRPSPNNRISWYSGRGFTVLQKLMKDVTGERFPFWMRDHILRPIDMKKSEFTVYPEQHYDEADLARGHDGKGDTYFIRRYPQYAAAGLYTNAEELANFIILINNKGTFNANRIINESLIKEFTTSPLAVMKRTTPNGNLAYSHGGTNTGFRALFTGYPNIAKNGIESSGIVVLTNGDNNIRGLITNAIAREYGW